MAKRKGKDIRVADTRGRVNVCWYHPHLQRYIPHRDRQGRIMQNMVPREVTFQAGRHQEIAFKRTERYWRRATRLGLRTVPAHIALAMMARQQSEA